MHDLTQVFNTPAALSQECYTQPGCIGDVLQNVTNQFDCCMQGQLEASFSDSDRCYFLQCLGECSTSYRVNNVLPLSFSQLLNFSPHLTLFLHALASSKWLQTHHPALPMSTPLILFLSPTLWPKGPQMQCSPFPATLAP